MRYWKPAEAVLPLLYKIVLVTGLGLVLETLSAMREGFLFYINNGLKYIRELISIAKIDHMIDKIEVVKDRLFLYDKLYSIKNVFQGKEYLTRPTKGTWDHKYKHFLALRYYLLLTCFDILGQREDFIDFHSWMNSKGNKAQRETIINESKSLSVEETIKTVYNNYLKIYGYRNSFSRFIKEILTKEDRDLLMFSIRIYKIHQDVNGNIIKSECLEDEKKKEDYLLMVRNQFTHKGKSLASGTDGLFHEPFFSEFKGRYIDGILKFPFESQYYEQKDGFRIAYYTRKWPNVIREVIENTLKR